jgi:Methyltransferase domain
MDLKEEAILGSDITTHWYYVSKGRALRHLLSNIKFDAVLDVGAGSGVFSRQLLDAGVCRQAVCVDPGYLEECTEIHNGREIQFTRAVHQVSQRLILMMDVLEHVDDDVGLLREYTDRMPQDSHVLITVPAFQFLWSGHDVFLEHRRRYTRTTIETVVRSANLQVVTSRYFFGILFPIVAGLRRHDQRRLKSGEIIAQSALKKHSRSVNTVLTLIHDVERIVLFPFNRFAGLTVFCLAYRA